MDIDPAEWDGFLEESFSGRFSDRSAFIPDVDCPVDEEVGSSETDGSSVGFPAEDIPVDEEVSFSDATSSSVGFPAEDIIHVDEVFSFVGSYVWFSPAEDPFIGVDGITLTARYTIISKDFSGVDDGLFQ